jgi:hypothetical protein
MALPALSCPGYLVNELSLEILLRMSLSPVVNLQWISLWTLGVVTVRYNLFKAKWDFLEVVTTSKCFYEV